MSEPTWPSPEHAQRIQFEGCECVVASPEEYEALVDRLNRLEAFAKRFLCPEDLGFAVTACVRDDARIALGQPAVEFKTWNKPT